MQVGPDKSVLSEKEPLVKRLRFQETDDPNAQLDQADVNTDDIITQLEKIDIAADQLVNEDSDDESECHDEDVDSNAESFIGNEYPDEDVLGNAELSSDEDEYDHYHDGEEDYAKYLEDEY